MSFLQRTSIRTVLLPAMLWLIGLTTIACGGEDKNNEDADVMEDTAEDVSPVCGDTVCGTEELCCNFVCVEASSDAANCGVCGNSCAAGQACIDGLCNCGTSVCGLDESCCLEPSPVCMNLDVDQNNCGACGNVCGQGEVCLNGTCACQTNDSSYESCSADETCCAGSGCHDLDFDPSSCGACGLACGSGELCVEGRCTCGDDSAAGAPVCEVGAACCGSPASCRSADDPECNCGTTLCGSGQSCCSVDDGMGNPIDSCVSTWREPQNCGGCGLLCGAAESCTGGSCSCQGGVSDCNDDQSDGCESRLDIDPSNCGACGRTCVAGEVCDGQGQCALRCQLGLTDCDGNCVDLNWSRDNCGTCGNMCAPGQVANGAGQCANSCLAGLTDCGGECVNIQANRAHCGACGSVCAPGEVCDGAGRCGLTCVPGLSDCGGNCVAIDSDRAHCGACGNSCPSGQVCADGTCETSCQQGTTDCDGACVDIRSSRFHCGACGQACQGGERCFDGACTVVCADLPNIESCGGQCVDVSSNRAHCGACSTPCTAAQRCEEGSCVDNCLPGFEDCGGACVDTLSSPSHCGSCGQACAAGDACFSGTCCNAQLGCSGPLSLAMGEDFGCAAGNDGTVWCWGKNHEGQLGDGTRTSRNAPVQVQGIGGQNPRAASVATGRYHACALLENATVVCWGDNAQGQLGNGTLQPSSVPVEVVNAWGAGQPELLVGGYNHTCVLRADRLVSCWGSGVDGQLGDGGVGVRRTPVAVQNLANVLDLEATASSTCALIGGQQPAEIRCWGRSAGCGSDCPAVVSVPDPMQPVEENGSNTVGGITDFVSISSGSVVCGRRADGSNWCWQGSGGAVEVVETNPDDNLPFEAVHKSNATHCGLAESGKVACWNGYLGHTCDYALYCEPSMGYVVDDTGQPIIASGLAIGTETACAILTNGQIACWGENEHGTVGDGSQRYGAPTLLSLPGPATGLDSNFYASCTVVPGTGVVCWGWVNGLPALDSTIPYVVPNTADAVEVAVGEAMVCYLNNQGAVRCWGDWLYLGNGCDPMAMAGAPNECLDTNTPGLVVGLDGTGARVVSIAAGPWHACAALDDGTVQCWGWDSRGGVGSTMTGSTILTPVTVTGLPSIAELTAGEYHSCGRTSSGAVWCWGDNGGGQLGVPWATTSGGPTPFQALGVDGITQSALQIHALSDNTIAVMDDGAVWAWGENYEHQLGPYPPSGENYYEQPTLIVDASFSPAQASTGEHTCFVDTSGAVHCMGYNGVNQLGVPSSLGVNLLTPQTVTALNGVVVTTVSTGYGHTCALTDTQEVWCWGGGSDGQIGDGTVFSPFAVRWWLP